MKRLILSIILAITLLLPSLPVYAATRNLYWVGDGGSWSDTNHWSLASGGAGGELIPDTDDNVFFDAQSFTAASQVVTVDVVANTLSMDWTGVTNTPTFAQNSTLNIYGSLTFVVGMIYTPTTDIYFKGGASFTLTSAGKTFWNLNMQATGGTITLQDTLNIDAVNNGMLELWEGTLDLNDQDLNAQQFKDWSGATRALVMGNGTLTFSGEHDNFWDIANYPGGLLTITAEGSTIILNSPTASAQVFQGKDHTYNNLTIQGSGNFITTINGNNTFNILTVDRSAAAKTIRGDEPQTMANFVSAESGTTILTITRPYAGATITLVKSGGGTITLDYADISYSTGSPADTWYYHSATSTVLETTQWYDVDTAPSVTTDAETGITMDRDGVTGGNFNGEITDLGGYPSATGWFEYGSTVAYGSSTDNQAGLELGAFTDSLPAGLTPGQTYHYRANASNAVGTTNGVDETFTLTMPTTTTGTATVAGSTVTLRGNITSMGVASDTYIRFQYGTTPALGSTTATQTIAGVEPVIATVSSPSSGTTLYYRITSTVGDVTVTGATSSVSVSSATGGLILKTLLRIALAMVILVGVFRFGGGNPRTMLLATTIGVIAFVIIDTMLIGLL